MVDFKQTNASDNPDHEQVERDRAEKRKEAADAAAQAGQQTSAEQRAREAQQGRGPAGLNKGPSDTTSADPHRPPGYPAPGTVGGGVGPGTSPGMGTSPPTRPQPTSDKPGEEAMIAEEERKLREARASGDPERVKQVEREIEERKAAKREQLDATADLRRAEQNIADRQGSDKDKDKSKDKSKDKDK